MYKKILLLLDCSPVDDPIIQHILSLAEIHHSSVHLFHVVHAHTLDQERVLSEKTEIFISKTLKMFQDKHIDVTFSIGEGEPAEEVLKKTRSEQWDLIALATHGHKALADFIYGSVSNTLKHKVAIPLLTVPGKSKSTA